MCKLNDMFIVEVIVKCGNVFQFFVLAIYIHDGVRILEKTPGVQKNTITMTSVLKYMI